MCSIVPLSMDDLSVLLHRNSKSFKNKNIKVLLENNQLFYWIPEMINHPQQNMLLTHRWREVIQRKIKKSPCGIYLPMDFLVLICTDVGNYSVHLWA